MSTCEGGIHVLSRVSSARTGSLRMKWWRKRGYAEGIPDEAPRVLEVERQAPSWRRLCKVLLRNDYWCKGLAFTQPRSDVYDRYCKMKKQKALLAVPKTVDVE